MRIYLAGRYGRREELQEYGAELERLGHEITSRWLSGDHEDRRGEARDAEEDIADVRRAELLLSFTESPRSGSGRGGRHVEFGFALALGKRLALVGPQENVFHTLPGLSQFADWPAARDYFQQLGAALARA